MTEQTKAERLADALEAWTLGKPTHHREAAAELRRLSAVEQQRDELLDALHDCVLVMERELEGLRVIQPELAKARAAIAKVEGKV
jgi:hypothetical protein